MFRKGFADKKIVYGTDDSIEFGSGLSSMGDGLFIMHNHPRNSGFSEFDVFEMISENNIKYISVVKNNGNVEILAKTDLYEQKRAYIERLRINKKYIHKNTKSEREIATHKLLHSLVKKGYLEWIK